MTIIHARIINPQQQFHNKELVPFAVKFWFSGKWRITGAQDRKPKDLDEAKATAERQFARNAYGSEFLEALKVITFMYE
jgi:hypothetical protein